MNRNHIKSIICGTAISAMMCVSAAIPSLSGVADSLTNLQERFAALTNSIAVLETRISSYNDRVDSVTNLISNMKHLVDTNQQLRERYHGGRIGQYKVDVGVRTNNMGRVIKNIVNVHLYADGSCWTNGSVMAKMILEKGDPEAAKKAIDEMKKREIEIRAAWERANLPPDLAAIREAQRQAATTQTVTVVVEGN